MNSKIVSYIAIFEIITSIFPIGITTPYAFADGNNNRSRTATTSCDEDCTCKSGCDAYNKMMSEIDEGKGCCRSPTADLKASPFSCDDVMYPGPDNKTFADCKSSQSAKYGVVPHHCAAKRIDELGRDYDLGMASTWTVVTAACLTACALTFTDITGIFVTAATATCVGGSVGATAAEIALTIKISTESDKEAITLTDLQKSGQYGALIGGAGAVGAAATVGGMAAKGVTGAVNMGKSAAAGLVAKTTAAKAAACASAGVSAVIMSLKWVNYKKNEENAKKECAAINKLGWPSDVKPTSVPKTSAPDGKASLGAFTGSGGTSGIKNSGAGGNVDTDDMTNNFPGSAFNSSAANSGPLGKLMDAFPNKKDFPSVLEKMGTNLGEVTNKLQTQSPASVIGSMMSLPPEASAFLNDIQTLAANGQIGGDASVMQGGGKGGSGGGSSGEPAFDPMSLFAPKKGADVAAGSNTMDFGSKIAPAMADGTDIWHSGVKGSIFQIISNKLEKTGNRIESLEWATPLNRALNGLPNSSKKR